MRHMKMTSLNDSPRSALWLIDSGEFDRVQDPSTSHICEQKQEIGSFATGSHIHFYRDSLPDAFGDYAEVLEDVSTDLEPLQVAYHRPKFDMNPSDP